MWCEFSGQPSQSGGKRKGIVLICITLCLQLTDRTSHEIQIPSNEPQALVSLKKYMPHPLPYFKVNIYPFPLPHFASIFFANLWSFRWPNYIVTLPRYFSFWLPHLNISTGPPSDKLDKNSRRMWLIKNFSQWNGYNHFRSGLYWFRHTRVFPCHERLWFIYSTYRTESLGFW
jgi:hypothetical protein